MTARGVSSGDAGSTAMFVIDDSATDRRLISALLEQTGGRFRTSEASTMAEALTRLASEQFSCVLLDLQLPDATGLDGLRTLAATIPTTAVVVLTGTDSPEVALEAVASGAQDYLIKGRIDVETLHRTVRYAVERQRIQNALASTRAALEMSESRFRHAFDDAPIGMALSTIDAEGTRSIIATNRALGTMLGTNHRELVGGTLMDRVHPDDRATAAQEAAVRRAGATTAEVRMRRDDGSFTWLKLTASLISDPEGIVKQTLVRFEDINEQRQAQQQITDYSFLDALTSLPNRLLALDRIRQALARCSRTGRRRAVLYLDDDHYTGVNDSLGHGVGDEVLRVVGARLLQAVRPEDTAARIGGDEFVVCCDDLPAELGAAEMEAVEIAERIRGHLERTVTVDGRDLSVTVSIGITISGEQSRNADELMRDADTALYRAKANGRSRWEVFDDALRAEAVGRLETERALRQALERVQLAVHYQPVVAIATREVVSAEALLRWKHPSGVLSTPSEFVRVAEETGLIVPIGGWVLDQSFQTLAEWRQVKGDAQMAINISAKQLLRSDLAQTVADLCDQYHLKPEQITLEMTERQLFDLVGSGLSELRSLADQGIRISLDDFGTGYGSLTYLRTLPVHAVKIDQSFVAGILTSPTDLAIVESVIKLGTALGLDVIAEGVETAGVADRLQELGCPHAQGWLYGRPIPAAELVCRA
jgi:diguanylate cyclase (GGDEF)-like protein/PAS domain S-box-containing protein